MHPGIHGLSLPTSEGPRHYTSNFDYLTVSTAPDGAAITFGSSLPECVSTTCQGCPGCCVPMLIVDVDETAKGPSQLLVIAERRADWFDEPGDYQRDLAVCRWPDDGGDPPSAAAARRHEFMHTAQALREALVDQDFS